MWMRKLRFLERCINISFYIWNWNICDTIILLHEGSKYKLHFCHIVYVYLAVKFLSRSIICRGAYEVENSTSVVGEEEAIWLLKLVLPYLNEFLLKFKALFSGDPATTIKLAVLLFVFGRCGSSITIWTMSKVAQFWRQRFKDAWDSCTHKRAVTIVIFVLVWNLSSVGARIWAAFILVVVFQYYQQKMVAEEEEWAEEEGAEETPVDILITKQKKGI